MADNKLNFSANGLLFGGKGEIRSFEDRWAGGINHYIEWLKEGVIEMHRVLKTQAVFFCIATGTQTLIFVRLFWIRFLEIKILEMK